MVAIEIHRIGVSFMYLRMLNIHDNLALQGKKDTHVGNSDEFLGTDVQRHS